MINIDSTLKNIYKNDRFPLSASIAEKDIIAYFPGLGLTVAADQFAEDKGGFELHESICADGDLKYGKCNSAKVKFTVADVTDEIAGKEFILTQTINETYEMPLGYFTVDTCPKQDDLRFKDITAYDRMKRIDIDVAAWYNSLTFPMTLAAFRASFLAYVRLEEDISNLPLPNDSMIITKTIEPAALQGRDVIEKIEEINGAFGCIGRDGKFKHVVLAPAYGDYPVDDYPQDDYPVDEYDTSYVHGEPIAETLSTNMIEQVRYEEYAVKEISKLIIRAEPEDIGAIITADKGPLIDTLTGTSLTSNKTDDIGTAEIVRVEGASSQVQTVQGKNLLPKTTNQAITKNGITFTPNSDGSITINGTASALADFYLFGAYASTKEVYSLEPGTYTIKGTGNANVTIHTGSTSNAIINGEASSISKALAVKASMVFCFIRVNNGITVSNLTVYPQLESGSASTAYAPFVPNSPSPDYPSPIISAHDFVITAGNGVESNVFTVNDTLRSLPNGVKDTYEVIGDKLYKVQRVGTVVLNGVESWQTVAQSNGNTDYYYAYMNAYDNLIKSGSYTCMCDKLTKIAAMLINTVVNKDSISVGDSTFSRIRIMIRKDRLASMTTTALKTYLASNPVTVQYELATTLYTEISPIILTTYKNLTNITTSSTPQVTLTAKLYGNTNNTYIIEGNFLLYGKSAEELQQIGRNAFGYMAKRPYRPYESSNIGLPYLEPGDMVKFDQNDPVVGYIFNRTLSGIQALQDSYSASGNREREQNTSVNTKIEILNRKSTKLKMDIEGVRVEVEDLAAGTNARFEVVSDAVIAEATRATAAEGVLSGQITVMAGEIDLRVTKNGVIAAINLSPEEILMQANKINFNGYATFDSNGGITSIDGSVLKTGTVIADTLNAADGTFTGTLVGVDGTFTGTLTGNIINGAAINGGTITGAKIISQAGGNSTTIENGTISTTVINMVSGGLSSNHAAGGVGYTDASGNAVTISTDRINVGKNGEVNARILADGGGRFKYLYQDGYTVIDSGNIADQSVRALRETVYVSAESNFRPYATGLYSCGTTNGKWSSVWASNGTIQTSDERKKTDIQSLEEDERFLMFAKMITPYTYRMIGGTSGRNHVGFIAQRIEDAMAECNISDMEFAGLIKAPVYAKMLIDEYGNQTDDYDTESEIIDYDYNLRYDEFIPLIFLWLRSLENR